MEDKKQLLESPSRPFSLWMYAVTCILLFVTILNGFRFYYYLQSAQVRPAPPKDCSPVNFDYFNLVIRWLPSACLVSRKCVNDANNWNIHGLWPNYNDGTWPQFCCDSWKFDVNKLKPIMSDLNKYWTDIFNKQEYDSFWSHEWSKHGTCSLKRTKSELDYFNLTLTLFKAYPIQSYLQQADIQPSGSATRLVPLADIRSKLEQRLGHKPRFECRTYSGHNFLQAVYICLDADASQMQDCKEEDSGCNQEIIYPTKDFVI